ncbi:MAG: tRNA (guanosine(46)-N7)-methyltransferase TrmB [Sulfurovaceae bacterium]|nr:tRNA (guanosine(46)-N7)-methyltransferase TrmB [Sulfurovaceae bacterium]
MPHITIESFDTKKMVLGDYGETKLLFISEDLVSDDEMLGVKVEEETFLLHIKKAKKSWLLKYDKLTRPLNVNLVKQAISDTSNAFDLKILNSNININKARTPLAGAYEKGIEDFVNIKFPFESVSIEVGFGSGKHLIYQAEKNPNRLFIGIEIHTPSAQQVLRQVEIKGLKNIWVVNYDARLLLEMIPSNIMHRIYVHFPVPWDKKPQRRVISKSFLAESMRVLEQGGKLELRTDSHKYFWYALDTFLGEGIAKTSVEIRKNEALEITSKYEARWLRQEKDIYDVYVTSAHESELRILDFNFSFNTIKYKENLLTQLPKEPVIFDDHFIHFERVYRVSQSSILLKLAFGSFDRPEHKYIYIDELGTNYFGSNPVQTFTNHKTHLKIEDLLNV